MERTLSHAISVPENWEGKHVYIRFEGVAFGYQLWVNGDSAGYWQSAFNPCQFDITHLIKHNENNTLAVRVLTRCFGYKFDTNDDWGLSGIFRDVKIFAVPEVHFNDLTFITDSADNNSASLKINYSVGTFSDQLPEGLSLKVNLRNSHGSAIGSSELLLEKNNSKVTDTFSIVPISNPMLWTAETPNLYSAELMLCNGNDTLQTVSKKIGIRKITIDGYKFLINGTPVKFRGVNMHEIHPLTGRVITKENRFLADLSLMKKANINMIRTSHYPPNELLLEFCDSMGFYVMDEVPFGFGDEWLNNVAYQDNLLTRADATVKRDKNHASVVIWSIGNENDLTTICGETGKYVKAIDPTRPICYPQMGWYFNNLNYNLPAYVDVFSPHYPDVATLKGYAKNSKRPLITTEYAHSLGLSFEGQKELWDVIENSPNLAGGCVWLWADQAVKRKGTSPGPDGKTNEIWISNTEYYDMSGDAGADGVVYPDRHLQTDYWELRKNYSQVKINENSLNVVKGSQTVNLTLQNKYDFVNLNYHLNASWYLTENDDTVQSGSFQPDCEPHHSVNQQLEIELPSEPSENLYLLHFDFIDTTGQNLYHHVIKLDGDPEKMVVKDLLTDIALGSEPVFEKQGEVSVTHLGSYTFSVNDTSGMINLADNSNEKLIVDGPYFRAGRKMTMAETRMITGRTIPRYLLANPLVSKVNAESSESMVQKSYEYLSDDMSMMGKISYIASEKGWVDITFGLVPGQKSSKWLLDAGISFLLNPKYTEFRWVGYGPFPSYPGKYSLNDYGLYHLTSSDMYFPGNHAGTDIALITDSLGNGIAILCDSANIDLDLTTSGILLSYNAKTMGKGTKFTTTSYLVTCKKDLLVEGEISVIPLQASQWPEFFNNLFNNKGTKAKAYRPYLARYDYYNAKISDITNKLTKCQNRITAGGYDSLFVPGNAMDKDIITKWQSDTADGWLMLEFCQSVTTNALKIAFSDGKARKVNFILESSIDGQNWIPLLNEATSNGETDSYETFTYNVVTANYFRIKTSPGSENKLSISELLFISSLAIGKIPDDSQDFLKVFPNPFKDMAVVELFIPSIEITSLSVLDMNGKTIKTLIDGMLISGNYSLEFIQNELTAGVYYLKLTYGETNVIKKIVKS